MQVPATVRELSVRDDNVNRTSQNCDGEKMYIGTSL